MIIDFSPKTEELDKENFFVEKSEDKTCVLVYKGIKYNGKILQFSSSGKYKVEIDEKEV